MVPEEDPDPSYDILTLGEARRAILRTEDPVELLDDELEAMNSAVSGQIDRLCGPVVQRDVAATLNGGAGALRITQTPVAEITTVTVDGVELEPTDYALETDGHFVLLHRRVGDYDGYFNYGTRNVVVDLIAGRFETTEDVDATWKGLARSILRVQWAQDSPAYARNVAAIAEDEGFVPGFISVEDMIRRRVPEEMLPPAIGGA